MKEDNTDHSGHRRRMLKRYLEHGVGSFDDVELLEIFLFTAYSRRNTYDISKQLIETFGSLSGVLNADYNELIKVKNIGPTAAALISFVKDFSQKYKKQEMVGISLANSEILCKFCYELMKDCEREEAHVLFLDQKMCLVEETMLFTGSFDEVQIEMRSIVTRAVRNQCYNIVLSHCHPGGMPMPSNTDVSSTRRIAFALRNIGISLADHIIVSDKSSYSMRSAGMIPDFWQII